MTSGHIAYGHSLVTSSAEGFNFAEFKPPLEPQELFRLTMLLKGLETVGERGDQVGENGGQAFGISKASLPPEEFERLVNQAMPRIITISDINGEPVKSPDHSDDEHFTQGVDVSF